MENTGGGSVGGGPVDGDVDDGDVDDGNAADGKAADGNLTDGNAADGNPGTVRPGGRTARVRAAVLRAVGDVVAEHGLAGLDLADVARRAEVGKTTVYRRWGTVPGLVADLLRDMAEQSLPRAGTGSLLGDLTANAELVCRTLADPRQGPLFKAVIAAAVSDSRTADALHRFYEVRVREWAPCVQQAIDRGEVPHGTDTHEVVRAVSAPLYYRLLTTSAPLDRAAAACAARAAHAAACAGVFVPGAPAGREPSARGNSA